MRILTTRLRLIPLTIGDADDLYPVLLDPELGRFTGEDPPLDVEALRERFDAWPGRRSPEGDELWLNWVVRRRADGRAVGYVQATVRADDAGIAWIVGTAFQRQGIATEAGAALTAWLHDPLGVPVVNACIHPDHVASRTVAERIGLRPTDRRYDGEVVWSDAPDGDR